MKWAPILGAVSVLTLLGGCSRGPVAGIDPFGRTTIPPPATRSAQGPLVTPAQVDPYYSGSVSQPPRLVPVESQSGTFSPAPAATAATGHAAPGVSQNAWRKSEPAPASGRLRPVSPSFLASDPGGSAEQALAWFNEEGRDAGSEYGESTSRLNWQQPGTATTVSSGTVSSSRPSRVELAQLPGGAVGGGRVPASFSGRAAASASRYGFSHDYAWLKGQLEYSATQQRWQLRYIPLDGQTDRYGGSLVLESVPELANFRNGDFIQVQGVVTGQNRSATGPAAAYRITRLARLK